MRFASVFMAVLLSLFSFMPVRAAEPVLQYAYTDVGLYQHGLNRGYILGIHADSDGFRVSNVLTDTQLAPSVAVEKLPLMSFRGVQLPGTTPAQWSAPITTSISYIEGRTSCLTMFAGSRDGGKAFFSIRPTDFFTVELDTLGVPRFQFGAWNDFIDSVWMQQQCDLHLTLMEHSPALDIKAPGGVIQLVANTYGMTLTNVVSGTPYVLETVDLGAKTFSGFRLPLEKDALGWDPSHDVTYVSGLSNGWMILAHDGQDQELSAGVILTGALEVNLDNYSSRFGPAFNDWTNIGWIETAISPTLEQTTTIYGRLWIDTNRDGLNNDHTVGPDGITVTVNVSSTFAFTTTTVDQGYINTQFKQIDCTALGCPENPYTVTVSAPDGYKFVVGGDSTVDELGTTTVLTESTQSISVGLQFKYGLFVPMVIR